MRIKFFEQVKYYDEPLHAILKNYNGMCNSLQIRNTAQSASTDSRFRFTILSIYRICLRHSYWPYMPSALCTCDLIRLPEHLALVSGTIISFYLETRNMSTNDVFLAYCHLYVC